MIETGLLSSKKETTNIRRLFFAVHYVNMYKCNKFTTNVGEFCNRSKWQLEIW